MGLADAFRVVPERFWVERSCDYYYDQWRALAYTSRRLSASRYINPPASTPDSPTTARTSSTNSTTNFQLSNLATIAMTNPAFPPVGYSEDIARRVRVLYGGQYVADAEQPKLVWETSWYPVRPPPLSLPSLLPIVQSRRRGACYPAERHAK